jgi:predicted metal-dependent peptidase
VVDGWLREMKIGEPPPGYPAPDRIPASDEERLLSRVMAEGMPGDLEGLGTAGPGCPDTVLGPVPSASAQRWAKPVDWSKCLAMGLQACVEDAVETAGGCIRQGRSRRVLTGAERARRWFIGAYPLMGAMAAGFELVEDPRICNREAVPIAAVCPESRELFINPAAGLGEEECRFVMAHELLHVGLRHAQRRQGRDAFLWNVACDYVINGWLVEMDVGRMPEGTLHDPELKGLSAESLYDLVVQDLRRFRRLRTYRGEAVDVIERTPAWWERGGGFDLDAFYRRALSEGHALHLAQGRGYLPAGLVEEIRALAQPPIPWEVQLAQWLDHHFPPLERRRSYARPSRRQSATPDIPRPSVVPRDEAMRDRTFGVVLDTSGSMDRVLLAKGLGTVVGYCLSRDVPLVRLVFCDAVAYDEGYVTPEDIAGRVRVRGRGGTLLQPGIDLLEASPDFPRDGPILVITDGACDPVRVRREHAFLMPQGASLPCAARGPVFRMK